MKGQKIFLICVVVCMYMSSFAQAVNYGEIISAETRTGSLTNEAQTDSFTFAGEADQAVIITVSEESGSGPNFEPEILLYDPEGNLEYTVWGWGYAEIREHKLFKSGIYTIVVKDGAGDDIGNYNISLLLILGSTVSSQDSDGGDIQSDDVMTGTIDFSSDTDAYTFNGEEDQAVIITVSEESGSGPNFEPEILLYDPEGNLEYTVWGWGYAEIREHKLLKSDIYTIVVKDGAGDDIGIYNLALKLLGGTVCTSDEECDDEIFCNGTETCAGGKCQIGINPCSPDELFCNGEESCDEVNDECIQGVNPCPENTTCNEDTGSCDPNPVCTSDRECDDGNACTDDTCVEGECVYTDNTNSCDDGLYCNGVDICSGGSCDHSGNPCPDDELFCNGEESCDEVNDECIQGVDPCPEDTTCNEDTDSCIPYPTPTECRADFIASPLFGCAPLKVHFTELCEGDVVSYKWDFGDGKTSSETNPTHTYRIGAFSPSLTCTSSDGSSDTEIKGNLIWASPYCPLVCSIKSTAKVNILRNLRDHIANESIFGPIVVNLYYQHAAEVSEILYERPEFKEKLRNLIGRHINVVNGVIKGRKVSLSEREVDEIVGFLHDLKEEGSPDLGRDVNIVIKTLQGGYFLQGLGVDVE